MIKKEGGVTAILLAGNTGHLELKPEVRACSIILVCWAVEKPLEVLFCDIAFPLFCREDLTSKHPSLTFEEASVFILSI